MSRADAARRRGSPASGPATTRPSRGPVVFALPGNASVARVLARRLGGVLAPDPLRRFPDAETYVRVRTDVRGRETVIVCTLDRADERTVPLLLLAATLRDLGARRVGLVAPYLGYMRQDARFTAGEGITSAYYARVLSQAFDWLATVDPHLHRHRALDAVYAIPATKVTAVPKIAAWIARTVRRPVIVGPDAESTQWAGAVAAAAELPCVVLTKIRRGDRDVEVSAPDGVRWRDHTPVLVDDIISTGGTIVATTRELRRARFPRPVCVAVHAVFAGGAYEALRRAGVARVVTCNTIPHPTNAIDVRDLLADGARVLLDGRRPRRDRRAAAK